MYRFQDETLTLTNLKTSAIVGIYPQEKLAPQPLFVSLSITASFQPAAESDNIQQALDYDRLAQAIDAFLAQSRFNLLETLARRLAVHLADSFSLANLELEVVKLHALQNGQGASARLKLVREAP